jgi:serine/threonine protein phosphatase PrpC
VQVVRSAGVEYVVLVCPQRGAGQDRARVVEMASGIVIALADGAGGTGGGAEAAQAIVDGVAERALSAVLRPTWADEIEALDRSPTLGGGQATAIVAEVGRDGLVGASAGDSQAWLVGPDGVHALTASQERKPLVGAGAAATPFGGALANATLVIASDGLFAYARRADIARVACGADLGAAVRALVELVRLPGGDLPDDVAIVLCRAAR